MRSAIFVTAALAFTGCNANPEPSDKRVSNSGGTPTFSLAASEYPSWSTFMVAAKAGLINPEAGGDPGEMEKKWGVDIVLQVKDYDTCITMYGGGTVDAVCITNMDSLNPCMGRPGTAILPTSTSVGADKVIGIGADKKPEQGIPDRMLGTHVKNYLKDKKVYGLSKSVSEYVFVRGLEKYGLLPEDYKFVNLDPAPAATALQTGSNDVKVICVWNPYALQTLRTNKNAAVLFSSSMIPEEIIDQVVVSNESLKKPGGEDFAACVCDTFYDVAKRLNNEKTADVTHKALGADFSNLSVDDMKLCLKETKLYATPLDGIKLYSDPAFQKTMGTVVTTCQRIGVLGKDKQPTIGYDDDSKQLNFSTKFMSMKQTIESK